MKKLTKKRHCSFCGEQLDCEMFYHDYALVKCDGKGTTYVEFDACQDCLQKVTKLIQKEIKHY